MSVCVFCLCHRENVVGKNCTYALPHGYDEAEKPKQVARKDPQLCTLCGLHQKNPKSKLSD